ncbi:MAG: translocation/assembly module TamB domain-containing protein [Candidatus Nucleicultricaceae bacterium]
MNLHRFRLPYLLIKLILKSFAFFSCLLVVAFLFFQTTPGKGIIKDVLKNAFAPYVLEIKEIKGFFPFHLTLKDVTVYEQKEKILECKTVDVAWSPLSLSGKKLTIDHLLLEDIVLHALPKSEMTHEERAPFWTTYVIEDFKADSLKIDEKLTQIPITFSIDGKAILSGDDIKGTFKVKGPLFQDLKHHTGLMIDEKAYMSIEISQTIQAPQVDMVFHNPLPLVKARIISDNDYNNLHYEVSNESLDIPLNNLLEGSIISGTVTFKVAGSYDLAKDVGITTVNGQFINQNHTSFYQAFKSPLNFSGQCNMANNTLKCKDTRILSDQMSVSFDFEKTEDILKAHGKFSTHPLKFSSHHLTVKDGKFDYQKSKNHQLHFLTHTEIEGVPLWLDSTLEYSAKNILSIKKLDAKTKGASLKGHMTFPFNGGALEGKLDVNITDLQPLSAYIGHPQNGTGLLKLSLHGTPKHPDLKGSVRIQHLKMHVPQKIAFDSFTTDYHFKGNQLHFISTLKHQKSGELKGEGYIPLHISFSPFMMTFPSEEPLQTHLKGDVDLSSPLLSQFLDEDILQGHAVLDIRVKGTKKQPHYDGTIQIKGGYWESFLYGTTLQDFNFLMTGDKDTLAIKELSAKDKNNGSIAVKGTCTHLLSEPRFFFTILAKNFTAIHNDELQSIINATLDWQGHLNKSIVSGRVDLLKTEITIPDKIEEDIPTIEIENPLEKRDIQQNTPKQKQGQFPVIQLHVDARSKAPIYVRGRGLNSQWQADLKLIGPLDQPEAKGDIILKRGTFDLIGKTLTLNQGEVKFSSSSILKPFFTVQGQHRTDAMSIIVRVSGTPDKFDIKLSSDPPQSEKEILSYFIFGKTNGELTMAQALQLASSLATLRGGNSLDVLGKVRSVFGLDTLNFQSGKEGDLQSGSLTLGKTLAEGVYVSVDQGLTPEDTKAVIDIDIAPSVVLETEVSTQSTGSIGLKYKWDY